MPLCPSPASRNQSPMQHHCFPKIDAVLRVQGAVTIATRYGATRQQFGPPDAPEVAVLDYTSQQKKLMPLLANAYALHFATRFLVKQYAEAKKTKDDELVADVHSLSVGQFLCLQHPGRQEAYHDCTAPRDSCTLPPASLSSSMPRPRRPGLTSSW